MYIHRLLYRSDAYLIGPDDEIARQITAIVERSRAANQAVGVTGALLFSSGVFIQALEGPLNAVEATFERICGDLRHRRVRLLELAVAEERVFADWSMAQVTPTRELSRLTPCLEAASNALLDASTANAAIQLMQTLLLTSATRFCPPTIADPLRSAETTG